jgi:3',5'-cyclic AMP phosphodiesterase CpdA
MPVLFHSPMTRRAALVRSASALAAVVAWRGRAWGADGARAAEPPLELALISDTHIAADAQDQNRGFFPRRNLEALVPALVASKPSGVVHVGDIARLTGEVADYEAVNGVLAPVAEAAPVYFSLGNHDDRANVAAVFKTLSGARQPVADKQVLAVEHPGLRLVILDSLMYPNRTPGFLGRAQRDWLRAYLETSDDRPAVLVVHHTLGREDGELLDVDRLLALVRPLVKVKAILFGHSHAYSYAEESGIHLVNLPAVGYNFADTEPVGWVQARFGIEGAELTLRAIGGNRQQDGQTRALAWRRAAG